MKELDNNIITEIDASQKTPIILVEQYLDGATLRWALAKENIIFGGFTYFAKTFTVDDVDFSFEGQLDKVSLNFDNIDSAFDAYIEAFDFESRPMFIKRIYLSGELEEIPSNPEMYNEVFYGEMEQPTDSDGRNINITAVSGYSLDKGMLNQYYGSFCQRKFGDRLCTVNLADENYYFKKGIVSGEGTTSKFKTNSLLEADNFWKHGNVKLNIDGSIYNRKVKSFSSNGASGEVTLDIGIIETIDLGSTFEIKKGCDFTWETCSGNNTWGPSGENTLNFFGFIHIGINKE